MTKRTRAGLIGIDNIDPLHTENFALCIPETDLAAVSYLFMEVAETYKTDHSSPTLYNDLHSPLTETVLICHKTSAHLQLTKEIIYTNSISFPPFYCREQARLPAPDVFI